MTTTDVKKLKWPNRLLVLVVVIAVGSLITAASGHGASGKHLVSSLVWQLAGNGRCSCTVCRLSARFRTPSRCARLAQCRHGHRILYCLVHGNVRHSVDHLLPVGLYGYLAQLVRSPAKPLVGFFDKSDRPVAVQWAVYVVMTFSMILITTGLIVVVFGWRQIYLARADLVTDGIYRYVRHPQYTGFFLIIFGFLIQWPTLITLAMAPILLWMYLRLARREEAVMIDQFNDAYRLYMTQVSGFIPRIR